MSLTDSEILELERLLDERDHENRIKSLEIIDKETSPNYKLLHESVNNQVWGVDDKGRPALKSGVVGVVLEGSSRSTKTWAGVFFILYLSLHRHKKDGCTINIYRETYNEFKTTLYDDFKRVLNMFGLPNKFNDNEEIKSFKIGKTKIFFLGDGKHGGGCDYAFFNEIMLQKQKVFDQVEMRCRIMWWADYNPSFTMHWLFEKVLGRKDVAFLRTTFKNNKFISATELNKILSYEPWQPGSYEVTTEGELHYQGEPIDDNNQPPPHMENINQGTADEFMWKVYGLGLRGAMKGQIFKKIHWIDKFPEHLAFTYGLDFGFVSDPTALVKFAKEGKDIYAELLIYQPIETPEILDESLKAVGVSKFVPITADSSDRYINEGGSFKMVSDLFDMGWEISKVSKTKAVIFWLQKMTGCRIHVVKNRLWQHVKTEQENYVYMEVNGIQINKAVETGAHFWDGKRYAFMSWETDNLAADLS